MADPTPDELAAEIAATAAALGGKSPREKKAEPEAAGNETIEAVASEEASPSKTESEDETVSSTSAESITDMADESESEESAKQSEEPEESDETSEPEPQTEPTADSTPAESEEHRLEVRVNKTAAATPATPEATDEGAKNEDKPVVIKHSGKTIEPISAAATAKKTPASNDNAETADDPETPESKTPTTEAEPTNTTPDSKSADSSGSDEAAQKLDAISGELKAKQAEKEAQAQAEQQTVKVYDTKKYHLPIKPNHHHRKSSMPLWAQLVLLALALIGAVLFAWTTDLIDFGKPSFLGSSSETAPEERAVTLSTVGGTSLFHLIGDADSIGSADVIAALYGDDDATGDFLSRRWLLRQSQSGVFWLEAGERAQKLISDYQSSSGVPATEVSTGKVGLDFIDIYNFSNLLAEGSELSLYDYLDRLEGTAAIDCQAAIDSAVIGFQTGSILEQELERINQTTGTMTRAEGQIGYLSFSLSGSALDSARQNVLEAVEACVSDDQEQTSVAAALWSNEDIVYRISDEASEVRVLQVYNDSIDRVMVDVTIGETAAAKSDSAPDEVRAFNHPSVRFVSAASICGDTLPLQLGENGLINGSQEGYRALPSHDIALVCPDSVADYDGDSSTTLIARAQNALSLKSIIETFRTDAAGYPQPSELDVLIAGLDAALPVPGLSQAFDYTVSPEGCGTAEPCSAFVLNVEED